MRFLFGLLTIGCVYAQQAMHLTLAEAQRLAIQNNPQYSAAKFTAAAAYQVPEIYGAAFQPNMSGSFTSVGANNGSRLGAGGLNNPVLYDHVGSGLSVSQLVADFGRTSNLVSASKLKAQAQDQATERSRAQILLEASRAYFAVLRAQAVLRVANQTVRARQLVADQVSALAESKLKSTLDVSFAKVNLSDAKLLEVRAQNDVKAAEAELGRAMGLPNSDGGFVLSEEPLPPILPDRVSELIGQAMQNRPEVKELQLRESSEKRFARAEHALFYPSVGVIGSAGFVPAGYNAVPSRYGAIGLNISIPVFNGGVFRARQTEAELTAKATASTLNSVQNAIVRDVRIAWLNATTAYDRIALTQEMLEQAQMGLELAQTRYDLGLGSIVELSQAQLNLTAAQIANANAKYDYETEHVNVEYVSGTLR